MSVNTKYQGIFPAFYACYDERGNVSRDRASMLAHYYRKVGVQGLYVTGSSGECVFQTVEERMATLEAVQEAVGDALTIIAHVAAPATADSIRLARHAERLGVDAIAAIPPIYFHLPQNAIAQYWNDISEAASNTDFIIYNIPQLAGVSLTIELLREMKKNPRVIGVKNSSMPVQDIQLFRDEGMIVFNGPDEQLLAGLAMGASGGIGGTYAAMPELYLQLRKLYLEGQMEEAGLLQNDICRIIYKLCEPMGNMYAVIKEVIRLQGGPDAGGVRAPLTNLAEGDKSICKEAVQMIQAAIETYIGHK